MSIHSDTSEPMNPTEADVAVLKGKVQGIESSISGLNCSMDEILKMMRSQGIGKPTIVLPPPPLNPYEAGTSQQFVSPRYYPQSDPPPPPLPRYEAPPPPPRYEGVSPRHHHGRGEFDEHLSLSNASDIEYTGRRRRHGGDDDRGLKIDLPEYNGDLNPEKYLGWISSMERIFEYKDYSESKKFKLAILKLTDYAALWWENLKRQLDREDKEPIRRWNKLKSAMDKKFLPKTYKQKLYDRLHSLKQEKKTVTEYIREFDEIKLRCDIPEAKEHTIARFIGGLHRDIANVVELQQYKSIDDVHKLALRIEEQKSRAPTPRVYPRNDFGYKKFTQEVKTEPNKAAVVGRNKGVAESSKPSEGPKVFILRTENSRAR